MPQSSAHKEQGDSWWGQTPAFDSAVTTPKRHSRCSWNLVPLNTHNAYLFSGVSLQTGCLAFTVDLKNVVSLSVDDVI